MLFVRCFERHNTECERKLPYNEPVYFLVALVIDR